MGLTSISLFTGAMGLDLGLERAGFTTRAAVEIDADAVATIRLNRPKLALLDRAIEKVTADDLLRLASLKRDKVDLISGGPCCQSFSTAGRRSSLSDLGKGRLFYEFKRIVSEIRPRFFVMENVRGILSAAVLHRPLNRRGPGFPALKPSEQFGSALKEIRKELGVLGYKTVFGLFNAADYGCPQVRYRVIFIGSRDGEGIELPAPTHSKDGENGMPHWVTLRQALASIFDPNPEFLPFRNKILNLLKQLKAGQNWRDLPKELHKVALGGAFDSWGGRSGFCRRLSWERPSPTLTTAPTGNATCLCHPEEDRPLSIKEYSVIQQFPLDWKFSGSLSQRYRQIGNAVPLGLGQAIGASIQNAIWNASRQLIKKSPGDISSAKGQVVSDTKLELWLSNRPKTQLNPPKMRRYKSAESARKWFAKAA